MQEIPITEQLATFVDSNELVPCDKIHSIVAHLDRGGSCDMNFSEFENGIKHVTGISLSVIH